jgi:hypothetical protein
MGLGFALAAPFYLLLIDTTALPELVAGAVIALLAGAAFALARDQEPFRPAFVREWLTGLADALLQVPGHIAALTIAALRQLVSPARRRGEFELREERPYRAKDRARREILGSLAPREIVVAHQDDGRMLVHRLTGESQP